MLTIKATKRDADIKSDVLRKSGEIPAVFYGSGKASTPISVSATEFKKVWQKAGESSLVNIQTSDEKDAVVLIHDVQTDPITDEPIHADFLAIDMNKKIEIEVPLIFEGISNAVKSGLGNLVKVLHELEIEALPDNLPHNLTVDLSKLETIDDQIFVSDIKLPPGVTAVNNPTDVVASIVEQVEEKEEAPVDLSAIEVEKKGKQEEEGEATDAGTPVAEKKEEKKQ